MIPSVTGVLVGNASEITCVLPVEGFQTVASTSRPLQIPLSSDLVRLELCPVNLTLMSWYTGVYHLLNLSLSEVQSESDLASEQVVRLEVGVRTFRLGVWANLTQVNLVPH